MAAHHAAAGCLADDPEAARVALPPEQAAVFVDRESPVYLMGAFGGGVA